MQGRRILNKSLMLAILMMVVFIAFDKNNCYAQEQNNVTYDYNEFKANINDVKAFDGKKDVTDEVKQLLKINAYDYDKLFNSKYDELSITLVKNKLSSNFKTSVATKRTNHKVKAKCYIGGNQYISWSSTVKGIYTIDLNKHKVVSARNPTISLKLNTGNGNLNIINYEPSYRINGDTVDFYYWYMLETQLMAGTNCRLGSFTDSASGGIGNAR